MCTLCCNLHLFLDIFEFTVENKKKLGKTVLKVWSPNCEQIAYVTNKTNFRKKSADNKKNKKIHESVHNLWRIIGTQLVLFVDFWNHIFKTVFLKLFYMLHTLNSKMSKNMCKWRKGQHLPHESQNFRNFFFFEVTK